MPLEAMPEGRRRIVEAILEAEFAYVVLAKLPEHEPADLDGLVGDGLAEIWDADPETLRPAVTLTPWGAWTLGRSIRERVDRIHDEEAEREDREKAEREVREPRQFFVIEEVPYWDYAGKPDPQVMLPRRPNEGRLVLPDLIVDRAPTPAACLMDDYGPVKLWGMTIRIEKPKRRVKAKGKRAGADPKRRAG